MLGGNAQNSPEVILPPRECVLTPDIRLIGEVTDNMLQSMLGRLAELPKDAGIISIEISTAGGDAEIGRRMVLEIDLARERFPSARFVFIGKTNVYSAGVTLMSAFPKADRFLCSDAVLLIHCRQLDKKIEISGPMRASLPKLQSVCQEIELGKKVEEDGFRRLIEGSDIAMADLLRKAEHNWYVPAEEAVKLGLAAGVV